MLTEQTELYVWGSREFTPDDNIIMSADDTISSIIVDAPIAMIAVCGWPFSIVVSILVVEIFNIPIDGFFAVSNLAYMLCY
jgi:hypothetical protein